MTMIKIIERYFWVVLIVALCFGLAFPAFGTSLNQMIVPLLMVLLFISYLKVDAFEVIGHMKRPLFVLYILLVYLLVIPLILYILFQFLGSQLALGFLLLAAMPPGMGAPALTDIVEGNTALTVTISFVAYIVTPFTLVFVLQLATGKVLHIDTWGLLKSVLIISFLPLIAAQSLRQLSNWTRAHIDKTKAYYSSITIFILAWVVYIVIANEAQQILRIPITALYDIFWLYVLFIILHVIGYTVAFWRKKEDKIALAVSKAYMNNALAIALAFTFFGSHTAQPIAAIMVLSEIPWASTLGIFKYTLKFLK